MVTNQDGLGTASPPLEKSSSPHDLMMHLFESQGVTWEAGADLPPLPHRQLQLPQARQPGPGEGVPGLGSHRLRQLLRRGDRQTDLQLAENMGIRGIRYHRRRVAGSPSVINCSPKGRTAEVERYTKETRIQVAVDLDKAAATRSPPASSSSIMLDQIATHAGFRLRLKGERRSAHRRSHTAGRRRAGAGPGPCARPLANKRGIGRFGSYWRWTRCRRWIDGRPRPAEATSGNEQALLTELDVPRPWIQRSPPTSCSDCPSGFGHDSVGEMATEMVPHPFRLLSDAMAITLQMKVGSGNTPTRWEALFKGLRRAPAPGNPGGRERAQQGCCDGKPELVIIDTGCANLASVRMAFERLEPPGLQQGRRHEQADKLILPGSAPR